MKRRSRANPEEVFLWGLSHFGRELGSFPLAPGPSDRHAPRAREIGGQIDWAKIERTFGEPFTFGSGPPALAPRLIAGLLYLQHIFDASDKAVVNTWVDNPYWPYFCGEVYLPTEALIDPSSLTRWRKPIGEEGVETLLMATIGAVRRGCVVKASSVDRVIVARPSCPRPLPTPRTAAFWRRADSTS